MGKKAASKAKAAASRPGSGKALLSLRFLVVGLVGERISRVETTCIYTPILRPWGATALGSGDGVTSWRTCISWVRNQSAGFRGLRVRVGPHLFQSASGHASPKSKITALVRVRVAATAFAAPSRPHVPSSNLPPTGEIPQAETPSPDQAWPPKRNQKSKGSHLSPPWVVEGGFFSGSCWCLRSFWALGCDALAMNRRTPKVPKLKQCSPKKPHDPKHQEALEG